MSHGLTSAQAAQRERFNAKVTAKPRVGDLSQYEKPRYGPWCPYWTVYARVTRDMPKGSRLLLPGCGTGRDALIYARRGYRVTGIDISDESIRIAGRHAEQYGVGNATFQVAAAEELPFRDGSFDAVVGVNVLHHVDFASAIREVFRVLVPGGRAIFKEPLATPIRDWFRTKPPVTWVVPAGVKCRPTALMYPPRDPTENFVTRGHLNMMAAVFGEVRETRFHVLAKLANVVGNRPSLERADQVLFRAFPVTRLLGDQVVLDVQKRS